MHVDVTIRTVLRAQTATDAVVFNFNLQRFAIAMNCIDGASDHAIGIHARPATTGDQIAIKSHAFSNQTRDPLVCIGAGLGALVTARTAF